MKILLPSLVFLIVCFIFTTANAQITNLTVIGMTANFTAASGDSFYWSYNLPIGGWASVQVWYDVDGNGTIDPDTDFIYANFVQTDGVPNQYVPGDMDGAVNGHIGYGEKLGLAPGSYIISISNGGGSAQIAGTITQVNNVAHQISGHVLVPAGYKPEWIIIEVWIGRNNKYKFWDALTDALGNYTIMMNADTAWNPWTIGINSNYPLSLTPSPDTSLVISDPSYTVNFSLIVTGIAADRGNMPPSYSLTQNYPNLFNPTTLINYQLPNESYVHLSLFNLLGQEVRTLVDRTEQPGEKSINVDANGLPSGIYFYRLEATAVSDPTKHFSQTRKMLLIR
ncbi:MAG: T9SS type A sorting domain-containing protein [Bacteroidota bacterium]